MGQFPGQRLVDNQHIYISAFDKGSDGPGFKGSGGHDDFSGDFL